MNIQIYYIKICGTLSIRKIMDKSSRRKPQQKSRKSEKGSRRRKAGKESRGKKRVKSRTSSRRVYKKSKESRQRAITINGVKFFAVKNNNPKSNIRHTHVMITTSGNKASSDTHYQVVRKLNDLFRLREYGSNGGNGNYWTNATDVYNLYGNVPEKYVKNGYTLVHLGRGYQFQIDFLPVK